MKSKSTSQQVKISDNFENKALTEPGLEREVARTVKEKKMKEIAFNLLVDSVPYFIKAVPFSFNDDIRFYISINGGLDHVFTWDPAVLRLRAIDDNAGSLPDTLEGAISRRIQVRQAELSVKYKA